MKTTIKQRENIVKQAIANEKLEGLKVSSGSREIANNYIAGKLSAKLAATQIRSIYKKV